MITQGPTSVSATQPVSARLWNTLRKTFIWSLRVEANSGLTLQRNGGVATIGLRRRSPGFQSSYQNAATPVDLATDGGSGTAPADFTYTPTLLDGTAVNNPDGTAVTGLTPKNRRDPALDYAAGDFGYLHRASDGTWALGWCNEAEADTSECSS
ncbi:MAG: hypothetical protein AAFY08_15070 [Planctomycetota bacterium]